jgi:hypothetical protein
MMEKKSKNTCDNYLIYVEDILKLISFNSSDTIIRRHINTNTYSYIYAFTITCSEKMAEKPIDALSEKVNHKLPFFMNYKPSCFRCTSVYSVKKHKEKTCWMKTMIKIMIPRSKITGRFRQESTGNRWNVEVVFPPEIFSMISDRFLPESTGN